MRCLWLGLLAAAGCNQLVGIDQLHDDRTCAGTLTSVCAQPLRGALQLADESIDTDIDPRCETSAQPNGNPPLCVIAAGGITVVGNVGVTGSRPLVLMSTRDLVVQTGATLDASSHIGASAGPNGDSSLCPDPAQPGQGGGGAGGSFGGTGGPGGNGFGMATTHGVPAMDLVGQVSGIHGGCPGGSGGPSAASAAGVGGSGGGAIYLYARNTLDIAATSVVLANGAGGAHGGAASAAGGGGSGGLIALESGATIMIDGNLIAEGGGGGGGGGTAAGTDGQDGTLAGNVRALGGAGGGGGGDGGKGTTGTSVNGLGGTNGASTGGGGGGGGAAGMIWVAGTATMTGSVTPPVTAP